MSYLEKLQSWLEGDEEGIPPEGYLAIHGGALVSSLPFPVLVTNGRFQAIAANSSFRRLFRISEDDLAGKRVADIIGGGVRIVSESGETKALPSVPALLGMRNPKVLAGDFQGIGHRFFHLYTRRIGIKGARSCSFTFLDLSKENENLERIVQSRRELLSIFDATHDPMMMIDADYRVRRINRAMLKVLGKGSYEAFIGRPCHEVLHGRSDLCPSCAATAAFASGEKSSRHGLIGKASGQESPHYEVTCHPIKDPQGQVTAVAESFRDLTEVTRLQEELYESERRRIVGPLAAAIAHEIRNPLAVIKSSAQYCLGEVGGNKDIRESLQAIVKSTNHANGVIAELLNFARPQEVEFERQPLRPILDRVICLVRAHAERQKIHISKAIPRNLPQLLLDRKRLEQAIMNLLINAIEAMPQGGRLSIEAGLNRSENRVRVLIRDTGVGIPQEIVSHLFYPFYTTKKHGVGLGLPVAQRIIHSHGGSLSFKDLDGKGTEAQIDFPLDRDDG